MYLKNSGKGVRKHELKSSFYQYIKLGENQCLIFLYVKLGVSMVFCLFAVLDTELSNLPKFLKKVMPKQRCSRIGSD